MIVFEAELIGSNSPKPIVSGYDQELLAEPRQSRQCLNAALTAFESGGTTTIMDAVKRVSVKLDSIDRHSQVDSEFIGGMQGNQGEQIMRDKLLSAVPHNAQSAEAKSLEGCAASVSLIARSALSRFISIEAKGQVDTCAELMAQLALKTPPAFSQGKMSALVQSFIDRLSWLCKYQRAKPGVHFRI